MQEMIKRRKDQGFTLIELMIVIAVIGILAIVLVPKVGTIKTQAKGSGLDTNIRVVEGYVQSKITKWADKNIVNTEIQADIVTAFDIEELTNPFNFSKVVDDAVVSGSTYALVVQTTADSASATKIGAIVVEIVGAEPSGSDVSPLTSIKITAHDNSATGAIIGEKTVTIKP